MYNLKKHIESVHKGRRQRDHKCTECKKAFSTKRNLLYHIFKDTIELNEPDPAIVNSKKEKNPRYTDWPGLVDGRIATN